MYLVPCDKDLCWYRGTGKTNINIVCFFNIWNFHVVPLQVPCLQENCEGNYAEELMQSF